MAITHTYVSAVPDDGNPNKVGSSEWNAAHTIAAQSIVTADIADANVTLGKMAANSVDASKVVDGSLTKTELNIAGALDGTDVKEGSVKYANGMIPLVYVIDIGAAGANESVIVTNKFCALTFWAMKTVNEASGAFDVYFRNGADRIAIISFPDGFNSAGCLINTDVVVYPTYQTLADGGNLNVYAEGASNMSCQAGVLGIRVP